jgi:hypothetical protein
MSIKKRFKELGAVVEIPDLHVWVSDDGMWGVGELVVVNATQWSIQQFEKFSDLHPTERWNTAIEWASATNKEGDKP